MLGELVKFKSTEGLHLDGLLFEAERAHHTVVHVHGSLGNFYQSPFIRPMAREYTRRGINLLTFNLATHDGIAEGYRHADDFEYVGGSRAEFESCVSDISGAIAFATELAIPVVLQGHSLGCDRVVHYLLKTRSVHRTILLSPCDSYRLQSNWIAPETIAEQVARLSCQTSDDDFDWVSAKEYGVRQGDWTYAIPITRSALLSILTGPPLRLFRLDTSISYRVETDCLAYLGGRDPLETAPAAQMFNHLRARFRGLHELNCESGDHNLVGKMDDTLRAVADWILVDRGTRA